MNLIKLTGPQLVILDAIASDLADEITQMINESETVRDEVIYELTDEQVGEETDSREVWADITEQTVRLVIAKLQHQFGDA
jgi:hypothetical protein